MKYRNIKVRILPNDAAPPAGLVPLADRELDQLITQASNDNIPLIDFGLAPPDGRSRTNSGAMRGVYGVTAGQRMSAESAARLPPVGGRDH